MEKLVLTDNTELEIMDGASLDYIRIQTDNFAALDQIAGVAFQNTWVVLGPRAKIHWGQNMSFFEKLKAF